MGWSACINPTVTQFHSQGKLDVIAHSPTNTHSVSINDIQSEQTDGEPDMYRIL